MLKLKLTGRSQTRKRPIQIHKKDGRILSVQSVSSLVDGDKITRVATTREIESRHPADVRHRFGF